MLFFNGKFYYCINNFAGVLINNHYVAASKEYILLAQYISI